MSVAPHGRICRDCKWFDASACRRYPPQMVAWPIDNQRPEQLFPCPTFPTVNALTDWCGEWTSGSN